MKKERAMTGQFCALNGKIHRLYLIRVTWPNGNRRYFKSMEEADKYLEENEPRGKDAS
jgi:hypothetical protein